MSMKNFSDEFIYVRGEGIAIVILPRRIKFSIVSPSICGS